MLDKEKLLFIMKLLTNKVDKQSLFVFFISAEKMFRTNAIVLKPLECDYYI